MLLETSQSISQSFFPFSRFEVNFQLSRAVDWKNAFVVDSSAFNEREKKQEKL